MPARHPPRNGSLYLSPSGMMIPAMINRSMIDRWFHGRQTGCQQGSHAQTPCDPQCNAETADSMASAGGHHCISLKTVADTLCFRLMT